MLKQTRFSDLSTFVSLTATFIVAGAATHAGAQVFDLGPSDPSLFDTVINLPPSPSIGFLGGIDSSTQLNLANGRSIGSDFAAGSSDGSSFDIEVNIAGGNVGDSFDANPGSEVNISGGNVGNFFVARPGSFVNISGGRIGRGSGVVRGGVANISGGTIGDSFFANGDVNISGGTFGESFEVGRIDSNVTISGGTFANSFRAESGNLELIGGEFRLNGTSFTGSTLTLNLFQPGFTEFTGTLMDGSVFLVSTRLNDELTNVTITRAMLPALDTTPITVNGANPSAPPGLRPGQTLTVQSGGSLATSFAAVDATLNVEGGVVGTAAQVAESVVNLSGGRLGRLFSAHVGSIVNISGGSVGDELQAFGSVVNISGGTVGPFVMIENGSVLNISGGSIAGGSTSSIIARNSVVNFSGGTLGGELIITRGELNITDGTFNRNARLLANAVLNISGGTVAGASSVRPGTEINVSGGTVQFISASGTLNISGGTQNTLQALGEVNLFGTEFFLDGEPLDGLMFGEAFLVTDRDATLSGLLADGSPFSFDLNADRSVSEDFFSTNATLTITLVPEPASLVGLTVLVLSTAMTRIRTRDATV